MTDICFTPATKLAQLIRRRKLSATEVMQAFIAQIERVNPKVNAIVTFLPELALASAKKFDPREMVDAYLLEQLVKLLANPKDEREAVSLLLLDLDGFKNVNDSLGHATGDLMLRETARRLERCVRAGDIVARLGGDEFAVVLQNNGVDGRAAQHVGTCMLKAIEWAYRLDGHDIAISTSIGVALSPRDSSDAATLLKFADTAMYVAKDRGRNHLCFYNPEMNRRAMRRRSMEESLRRAVDANEFELYYQPKWSSESGACGNGSVTLAAK